KQAQHRELERVEVDGIVLSEEEYGGDAVDVEEQEEQDRDIGHAGDALQQRRDEQLKLRDRADQAEDAEQSNESQHHDGLAAAERQKRRRDDREVEAVPRITEEAPRPTALGDHLDRDLEREDGEHGLVEDVHGPGIGFV